MYTIKTTQGYITVKPGQNKHSFTENINFAYIYDTEQQAQKTIDYLGIEAEIIKL
jgi:hypothetical protein